MTEQARNLRVREAAWLLFCALTCLTTSVLLLGKALGAASCLLFGTDTVSHDYIMGMYGWREILSSNSVPLWCPYLFGGFPFIGSFAFCPFYPTQWLFAILPFNTAFTLQYVLAISLGGVTTGVWARTLGSSRLASLCAAVLFCVSGHFLTLVHAGHLQKVVAIAWAPLALAMAMRLAAPGPRGFRAALLAGVAFAMQLLASHTQIAYATAVATFVLGLVSLWSTGRRSNLAFLGHFALALGVAAALSAVQLFPGLETAAISNRAQGVSFAEATETSYHPRELWEFVIPRVFGDSAAGSATPYFGFWGERIVSDFIGFAAILLALIGWLAGGQPMRWPLAVMTAVSLVVGLGRHTPIYRLLYDHAPGFAKFRSPGTFMFLATASLVQLCAFGLDALRRSISADRGSVSRGRILFLISAAALLGVVMIAFPRSVGAGVGIGTAEQWAKHGSFLSEKIRMGGLHCFAVAALSALTLFPSRKEVRSPIDGTQRRKIDLSKLSYYALLMILILVPALANRHFILFAPLDDYLRYLFSLKKEERSRGEPSELPCRSLGTNLLDNRSLLSKTGSLAGYHPIFLKRFGDLVETLGWYHPYLLRQYAVYSVIADPTLSLPTSEWQKFVAASGGQISWRQRDPRYARLSRFVVVHFTQEDVLRTLAANALLSSSPQPFAILHWDRTAVGLGFLDHGDWAVCDAKTAWQSGLPIFASSTDEVRDQDRLSDLANFASGRQALFDILGFRSRPDGSHVSLLSYRPGAIECMIHPARNGLLVIAENYAPGWKARDAHGRKLVVLPINYAQLGVVLGSERDNLAVVKLAYAPFSWRLGLFLSLVGWAACLGYVVSIMFRKCHITQCCWTTPPPAS